MHTTPIIYRKGLLLICLIGCSSIVLNPEWRALVAASYSEDIAPTETIQQQEEAVEKRLEELREFDDLDLPRWGLFASVSYGKNEKDTRNEIGYKGTVQGITVGTDYRIDKDMVVGVAAATFKEETDLLGNAGSTDIESNSLSLYSGLTPTENSYVDVLAGYTRSNTDKIRINTDNTVESTKSGYSLQAALNAGYTYNSGAFSYGPVVDISFARVINGDITATQEGKAPVTSKGKVSSTLKTNFGARVAYASSFNWGVLSPFASLMYQHETTYKDDPVIGSDANKTDDPDNNTYMGRVGFSAAMPNHFNLFLSYQQLFAHDYLHKRMTTIGVRTEF